MIGSIIGGGLKAVGSIVGGMLSAKAMRKYKRQIEAQKSDNQNWYDRRYNEDATQRADAQALLNNVREHIKQRNANIEGAKAVMGGTDEAVAAEKAANANAMSNAVSNINAMGEARKDAIEQQYMQRQDSLNAQLGKLEVQRANNIAQAAKGVMDAGAGIAGAYDGKK